MWYNIYTDKKIKGATIVPRKVKCPYCGQFFERAEDSVCYKNRWYHKHCYDMFWEVESVRLELIDFILRIFKLKSPGPKIYAQINLYQEKWNMSYKDILMALKYFYEVQGNTTEKSNAGIGIVPHVVDQATRYYAAKEATAQSLMDQAAQYRKTIDSTGTHIVIEKEKITEKKKHKKKSIDINEI